MFAKAKAMYKGDSSEEAEEEEKSDVEDEMSLKLRMI
jgi:hypothetical protein